MEKWTEVRRRVLTGELSKRAACREYGINWRTLAKMLANAEPPGYRRKAKREQPVVGPHLAWIHEVLENDEQEPKKQRHTAKRIFDRLKVERGYAGGYTMVKEVVKKWKATTKEVFVPLSHPPGEAQVDFGFAYVGVAGERQQIALFVMSLPYSDAVSIQAFPRECTEAFVEGRNRAFRFIGGVPEKIRHDDSKIAVAKITGSRERQVTKEVQRLQGHDLFETQFCLVRRANEKGHVEGLVDFGRANFLVPVPKVGSLVELNETLEERCREDLERRSWGKHGTKALRLEEERSALLPLPAQECEARRITQANANSLSLVQFDTNRYSASSLELAVTAGEDFGITACQLVVRRDVSERAVEPHLVVVSDEVADDASCLLGVAWSLVAELLALERAVPAFELAVALRVVSQPSRGMWALWAWGLP